MSRFYRTLAVATALVAALFTAGAILWSSGRARAAVDDSGDGRNDSDEAQVVVVDDDDGDESITIAPDDEKKIKKIRAVVVKSDADDGSAFLGVELAEETKHPEGGARIDGVVSDSPAEKAGLKEGDIVVTFDGHVIRGPMSLSEHIHAAKPGDKVDVEVIRDGRRQKFDVEMGKRPRAYSIWSGGDDEGLSWIPDKDSFKGLEKLHELEGLKALPRMKHFRFFAGRPKLGIQVVETTPDLREHLGGPRDSGILVGKVMSGMPAEKAGLKVGDLVVSVDGQAIGDAGELVEALSEKDGKTVDLEVIRDHRSMHVKASIPEAEEDEEDGGPQAYLPPPAPPAPEAPPAPPEPSSAAAPPAPPPAPMAPPAPPAAARHAAIVAAMARREAEAALANAQEEIRAALAEALVSERAGIATSEALEGVREAKEEIRRAIAEAMREAEVY